MARSGAGVELADLQAVQALILQRAHALTSYTGSPDDATFLARYGALDDALASGHTIISGGRGDIPTATWESFIDTVRRQDYTLESQFNRTSGGTPADAGSGPRLILGEGQRIDTPRTGGTTTPPGSTSGGGTSAPGSSTTTATASIVPDFLRNWETKLAPNGLWVALNPPGEPVYRKPIFYVGLAAGAAVLYFAYKGSK